MRAIAEPGPVRIAEPGRTVRTLQVASISAVDEDGDTALHLAAMRGHYDVIISLLRCPEQGAPPPHTGPAPVPPAHKLRRPLCAPAPQGDAPRTQVYAEFILGLGLGAVVRACVGRLRRCRVGSVSPGWRAARR